MSKPWTGPEIKETLRLFKKYSVGYVSILTGRSIPSIQSMAARNGDNSGLPKLKQRSIFAQDVAIMMEMAEYGKSHKEISKYMHIAHISVKTVLWRAKKHGFDAYPMRIM